MRATESEPRAYVPDVHPADCQSCSENPDPCRVHAEDWRYWFARAMEAEADAGAER